MHNTSGKCERLIVHIFAHGLLEATRSRQGIWAGDTKGLAVVFDNVRLIKAPFPCHTNRCKKNPSKKQVDDNDTIRVFLKAVFSKPDEIIQYAMF